jgi:hypothetical protein
MGVRIKRGALVGQDFGFWHWGEIRYLDKLDTVFELLPKEVFSTNEGRRMIRAYGFGVLNGDNSGEAYGNGSIFVKETDLIEAKDPVIIEKPIDSYAECLLYSLEG